MDRCDDFHFRQGRMFVQLSRAPRDVSRLIGDALDIGRKFHRRHYATQIRRDRLKSQQDVHAVLVDLFFQLIDLFVISDGVCAKIIVSLEQALNCAIQTALGQSSHY